MSHPERDEGIVDSPTLSLPKTRVDDVGDDVSISLPDSLDQILAEGNEEDIARILEELQDQTYGSSSKLSIEVDEESLSEHERDEFEYTHPEDETDSKLEMMDDMSFDELLAGLVMSPNEDKVSGVELLQSKLAALKSQYTDILGADIDIFGDT